MVALIRIDVDNPFGWGSFRYKVLNYLALNYRSLKLRSRRLGYLKNTQKLFDDMTERNIPGTWFTRVETRPSKSFARELIRKGHEPALHVSNTLSSSSFQQELKQVQSCFEYSINGFSKHGSGELKLSRYHDSEYNENYLIDLGKKSNLIYFSGNGEEPTLEPQKLDSFVFFPSAFWIARQKPNYDIQWLVESVEKKNIVILVHPFEWVEDKQVRQDYERIIDAVDKFSTFTPIVQNIQQNYSS